VRVKTYVEKLSCVNHYARLSLKKLIVQLPIASNFSVSNIHENQTLTYEKLESDDKRILNNNKY